MFGFFNKALYIEVGLRTFQEDSISDEICQKFLGGKGLGTYLLNQLLKPGIDPLSKDNIIIFAIGPATATRIWGSSRYGVFTKSPLTGIYCESYSGGDVAGAFSRTGYDAVVIKGTSEKPIWLEITSGKVIFHDASSIWGMDTYATEDTIRASMTANESGIAVIGPAGENCVRFASIANNHWRCAGRSGAGAVLGSKKVKAVVFQGHEQRLVAQPGKLEAFARNLLSETANNTSVQAYRKYGTPMIVATANKAGAFPTRYWSAGKFEQWEKISADALLEKCRVRAKACPTCFLACGKLTEITDGRHQGLVIEGPEYETIYAFGGLCLIDDIREIAYLNDRCDRLGIDTITAGNLAGFTIEASHKVDLGAKLEYGDADGIAELLNKIVNKQGIGAILAQGIKAASREWGLEDLAIQVKGLEPSGYDPRVLKGMGLAFAVSDRGACHLRASVYKAEFSGAMPPDAIEGKAGLVLDFEDRHTLFDALIVCRFYRDLYPWEAIAAIIELTTGLKLDKPQLQKMALGITNLARDFNLREGMTASDDTLPRRFFREKLGDSGKTISPADLKNMLNDYYALKGW